MCRINPVSSAQSLCVKSKIIVEGKKKNEDTAPENRDFGGESCEHRHNRGMPRSLSKHCSACVRQELSDLARLDMAHKAPHSLEQSPSSMSQSAHPGLWMMCCVIIRCGYWQVTPCHRVSHEFLSFLFLRQRWASKPPPAQHVTSTPPPTHVALSGDNEVSLEESNKKHTADNAE